MARYVPHQTWPRCRNKIRYPSAAKARKYARIQREAVGAPLRTYECERCGGWHLTKRPQR